MAEFIGYHGTDASLAVKIQKEGFIPSSSDNWMGEGVYFFETILPVFNGHKAAKWWALTHKKFSEWVIFKALIKSNLVCDLVTSWEDRKNFGIIKRRLFEKHNKEGGKIHNFNILSVFLLLGSECEVIRCIIDGARIDGFPNYVVGFPQIQICVKNKSCISNICKIEEGQVNKYE